MVLNFTTAGNWDCVVTVKRLSALHNSVEFIFSSPLGSLIPFWSFEDIRGSLMSPNWPNLASLAQKTCTLDSLQIFGVILASKG